MSLPKLGIVSIGVHDDVLNWVAEYKPASILIVNERGQSRPERPWENNEIDRIRATMAASPKTLWIFRSWPDGIGEGDTSLDLRMTWLFEPFMDMPNPKMAHSWNEPGFPWIQASGDARRLAEWETQFAKSMHEYGLLSMNFCFSESHLLKGNMGLWHIFAEALPYVDALGFNEYDWPNWDTSRDQGYKWRTGHWEHQVERLRSLSYPDDKIPPVIIGEGILDGKIQYPHPHGWQKKQPYSPRRYVDTHQAVYDDTYYKPEVFAHHTFCYCHPSSEWNSYNVKPILYQLGQLVQNQVYWEDYQGGETVGLWDNVPGQIKQWRPIIEKVTSSFHVPIPDYNGIHVSPAKVVTCIIQKESNGDPKIKSGKAALTYKGKEYYAWGLMQVVERVPGLTGFDGRPTPQELQNPETNIRWGLQILQGCLSGGSLYNALYLYSGGKNWTSGERYKELYWQPFVKYYKQFWGVDLEPESAPSEVEELKAALADREGRMKAAIKTLSWED